MVIAIRTIMVALLAGLPILAYVVSGASAGSGPTPEQYLVIAGKGAKLIPPGKLKIAGYRAICGRRPTVLDSRFDSWGGAYPGFMILNPKAMRGLPRAVKLYIYAHECGHQFRGGDEDVADCFAIKRGVRRGWLKDAGMNQICQFISRVPGDSAHPPGTKRCKSMRVCYKQVNMHRARR